MTESDVDHRRKAAEAHGNLDLWLRIPSSTHRYWLEGFTMREICAMAGSFDHLAFDHSVAAGKRERRRFGP